MVSLENFFKIIVFNYIFSNGDAHLKNFSLIRNDFGEMELSPSYDLMSTIIHTPNESDTALPLYDEDYNSTNFSQLGFYGKADFVAFAQKINLIEIRYVRILDEFSKNKESILKAIDQSYLTPGARALYRNNVLNKISRI